MVFDTKEYKQTVIGNIPNEWQLVLFKNVCTIVDGQVDPTIEPFCNMPHIGNANIDKLSGKLLNYRTAKEDQQTSGKYLFDETDILYGKINPHFGKVAFPKFRGICSADIYPIKSSSVIKPEFLKYLLLDQRFIAYTTSVSGRTGIPKVNRKDLEIYQFALPPISEQKKIADILTSIDNAISKTEAIIEQMEKVKKGLMQQLLTKGIGHTRFKQTEVGKIPEGWILAPLESYCEHITYGFTNPMPTTDSGPYMVTAKDIVNGKINYGTARRTDVDMFNNALTPKSRPQINDILITKDGTLGRLAIVDKGDICINQSVATIRLRSESVNVNFLFYLLGSPKIQERIFLDAGGSTIKHIYITKLGKMLIPIPNSIKEQNKIVKILSIVDRKIANEQEKLTQQHRLKKGLMQDLLTGKVRVKVDEQEAVNT